MLLVFFLMIRRPPRSTRTDTPFPTRRSSDLLGLGRGAMVGVALPAGAVHVAMVHAVGRVGAVLVPLDPRLPRSEEHTSELQSLMRISYAVFCLKKKKPNDR